MRDVLTTRQLSALTKLSNAGKWLRVATNDKDKESMGYWSQQANQAQSQLKHK